MALTVHKGFTVFFKLFEIAVCFDILTFSKFLLQ